MSKINYETKPLTLEQRVECNDIKTEMNPEAGTVIVHDVFSQRVKYLRYGLKTLEGKEVTKDNFDELAMTLSNDDITVISDKIAEETNFSKKK